MSDRPPDESTLLIPDAWRAEAHPRRGGLPPVSEAVLDPSARERVRERVEAARPSIEQALEGWNARNRRFVEAGRAYLRGEPDPVGAAVVARLEMLVTFGPWKRLSDESWIDAWCAEHGLAFAACAGAEVDGILAETYPHLRGESIRVWGDNWGDDYAYWTLEGAGRRMRALLAAAGDADYAEAVERLAGHRRHPMQNAVVSYLVPARQDWVDECLAESDLSLHARRLLWCSITTVEQAARLGSPRVFEYYQPQFDFLPGMLATVAEGVGPAIAPQLVKALDEESDVKIRKVFLDALAALPTDQAFGMLAERLGEDDVRPAVVTMTRRFPGRTLRVLARVAEGESEAARVAVSLLDEHLRAWHEPAAEELPAKVRSALERVRERRVEEAAARDLPKALTSGRAPEPPAWAAPAMLPQLLLRGRHRALSADAAARLIAALSKTGPRRAPAANVREALEACDPVSLAAFGWALFDRWRTSGEVGDNGWPLSQLRWTGDDATARRIGTMVRSAAWRDGVKLPQNALTVLAAMGTDVAMMQLSSVAENVKPKAIKRRARKLLDQVAEERGLTRDQLADRLVPDFGLDADGSMTLDYGPRRFTVGFDEQLRPQVFDEKGVLRKSLPKPGAKDDPALAPAAHQRFAGLKKDVRTLASAQIRRMERAMAERRRWESGDFQELLVRHPLMWHVVRRLVWLHEDGGKATAFRVAEDRTLADADDDVLTLPESGRVGVAHPVELGDELDDWGRTFADYEIMQPFPQLGRTTYAFTPQEREAVLLERFEGLAAGAGPVLGLERRGWVRGGSEDGGMQPWFHWNVPETGRTVTIEVSPGVPAWNPGATEPQTVRSVRIAASPGGDDQDIRVRFGDLDPVSASELLLTLHTMTETTD
ncbi:DUF4132 domain-containing protein [Spirillospora sp. CA-255316]